MAFVISAGRGISLCLA